MKYRIALFAMVALALAASSANAEPTEPKRGAAAKNAHPKLIEMYEAAFYNDYKGTYSRGDRKALDRLGNFAEQQRILKSSGAPDTYWITGWDGLAAGHRELAVIQGGINRTWLEACHADFENYEKRWKPVRASFDEDFAYVMADSTTFYEGAERIREMWKRAKSEFESKQLYLPGKHILNRGYIWSELVELEYALAARTGRLGMNRYIAPSWAIETTVSNPSDATLRRTVYCWAASTTGTPTLPYLSQSRDYRSTKGKDFIRHVTSKAEAKEIEAWKASARPVSQPAKALGPVLHVTSLKDKTPSGTPAFVGYGGSPWAPTFEVRKVKRKGDVTHVELTFASKGVQKYDCKTTNELQRIDSDGTLLYHVDCKTRPTTFSITAKVAFSDLPQGVQVGDQMGVYGTVTKFKSRRSKTKTKITVELDALHLRDVRREREIILAY